MTLDEIKTTMVEAIEVVNSHMTEIVSSFAEVPDEYLLKEDYPTLSEESLDELAQMFLRNPGVEASFVKLMMIPATLEMWKMIVDMVTDQDEDQNQR